MKSKKDTSRPAPEKIHGPAHLFAALRYSMGGLSRLAGETAFLFEIIGLFLVLGLLALIGAGWYQMLGLVMLFLILFAVEALNTAIECIVNEISPDYSEFAKQTKDLGSVAVFFIVSAIVIYAGFVIFQTIAHF